MHCGLQTSHFTNTASMSPCFLCPVPNLDEDPSCSIPLPYRISPASLSSCFWGSTLTQPPWAWVRASEAGETAGLLHKVLHSKLSPEEACRDSNGLCTKTTCCRLKSVYSCYLLSREYQVSTIHLYSNLECQLSLRFPTGYLRKVTNFIGHPAHHFSLLVSDIQTQIFSLPKAKVLSSSRSQAGASL